MGKFTVKGVVFKFGTAGGSPSTTVTQNGDLNCDFGERELVDVTTNDSPEGVREHAANFLASASMSQEIVWDPTNSAHSALQAAHASGDKISFGFVLPQVSDTTFYADGFVTNMTIPGAMTSALKASFSFKATGPYTFST
jgi:hypothetical protein